MPNRILLIIIALFIIFLVLVMQQPDSYRVERAINIEAPAENVYDQIADLSQWPAWSPWATRDPAMQMTYSEATTGVGAWAAWDSESEGRGRQTIREAVENRGVKIDLEFIAPFEARAVADFAIAPGNDGSVMLTWGMDGRNDGFVAKALYLLMDFEGMIGADYETGLQAIKLLAEQRT